MRKTVRDDLGRDVTLESAPRRIVCLCPSLTETLFTLGAGQHMVGRTRYCTHPATEVQRVARVGGTNDVDIDQIRTGNGWASSPVVKKERTKSSNDSANVSSPAATIAGQSSGSSTSRTDWKRVAPRSIAACSTSSPIEARRPRTTTVT